MADTFRPHNGVLGSGIQSYGDLSAKQYYGAAWYGSADLTVKLADSATGDCYVGVILANPNASLTPVEIFVGPGICPIVVGAAITRGYPFACDATATYFNGSGAECDNCNIAGWAVKSGTAAQIIEAFCNNLGFVVNASLMFSDA
jgi:hypothetical protein